MTKKKEPQPTESRDRVFIGVTRMDKLKALADRMSEKTGIRPTVQQVIGLLIDRAR